VVSCRVPSRCPEPLSLLEVVSWGQVSGGGLCPFWEGFWVWQGVLEVVEMEGVVVNGVGVKCDHSLSSVPGAVGWAPRVAGSVVDDGRGGVGSAGVQGGGGVG